MLGRKWMLGLAILIIGAALLLTGIWILRLHRRADINDAKSALILQVSSPSFSNNGAMPQRFSCDGPNVSPEIDLPTPPPAAKSYLLLMEDTDAPLGFVHWIVYNLPANTRTLVEGASPSKLPPGAAEGTTTFGNIGYGGPCPPGSKSHRYVFRVYALDLDSELPPGLTKKQVAAAVRGHILEEGELTGLYTRTSR